MSVRHDPGLAASPRVGYTLKVEGVAFGDSLFGYRLPALAVFALAAF